MRREIGIYGGTFAPPHAGHFNAAMNFCSQLNPERLYIIPAAVPPHKTMVSEDNPSERIEMLRLAFEDHPDYNKRIFISDYEIMRRGLSYTVHTLEHFAKLYPPAEDYGITLLCGTDMFLTLAEWYQPERIFTLCRIAHIRRGLYSGDTENSIIERTDFYKYFYHAEIISITGDIIEISSSDIRKRLYSAQPNDLYINKKVYEYIKRKKLYMP